jgi:hypothetical protein
VWEAAPAERKLDETVGALPDLEHPVVEGADRGATRIIGGGDADDASRRVDDRADRHDGRGEQAGGLTLVGLPVGDAPAHGLDDDR